jgi:hypothetical protein
MGSMIQINTQQNDQEAFDTWFDERLETKLPQPTRVLLKIFKLFAVKQKTFFCLPMKMKVFLFSK